MSVDLHPVARANLDSLKTIDFSALTYGSVMHFWSEEVQGYVSEVCAKLSCEVDPFGYIEAFSFDSPSSDMYRIVLHICEDGLFLDVSNSFSFLPENVAHVLSETLVEWNRSILAKR